jgi:hypothetical protein
MSATGRRFEVRLPSPEPGVEPYLKLHIEPTRPIEIDALTGALGSLSRQYQSFIGEEGFDEKAGEARLLVSSVSQGSIDIRFLIDLAGAAYPAMPALLPVMIDKADLLVKFAGKIKKILDYFLGDDDADRRLPTIPLSAFFARSASSISSAARLL